MKTLNRLQELRLKQTVLDTLRAGSGRGDARKDLEDRTKVLLEIVTLILNEDQPPST